MRHPPHAVQHQARMAESKRTTEASRCDHAVLAPGIVGSRPAARWQRAFPGSKDQAGQVRAALHVVLACCPVADDVLVLVSELVANAVCYSDSKLPGGQFTVCVHDVAGEYIHAAVEDGGSDWDGDLAKAAEWPHGLYLLQKLATSCGTAVCRRQWTVWFTVDYPSPRGSAPLRPLPP